MATELSQREFALGDPRLTSASSITSSWYRVARCVSSMATAAGTTRSSCGSPNCAASSTRVARKRLPPASIRYADVSSSRSYCALAAFLRPSSTRASPSVTSAASAASASSTGTTVIPASPTNTAFAIGVPPSSLSPRIHQQTTTLAEASPDEELRGRVVRQPEQRFAVDPQDQRRQHSDTHRDRAAGAWPHHGGPVDGWLAEEHQHDDPDIGEGQDRAAQHADDDQRQGAA